MISQIEMKRKISVWKQRLEIEGIPATEENIFIAAACDEKGIAFLKGESPLNVRKNDSVCENDKDCKLGENNMANASGNYTVIVDGQRFNVTIAEGNADIQVTPVATTAAAQTSAPVSSNGGTEVPAAVNGAVWKILVKEGDRVEKDQQIMILEAMKMEIDITAPVSGVVTKILVNNAQAVDEGQPLAIIG